MEFLRINVSIPTNHILPTRTKSNFITFRQLLPIFYCFPSPYPNLHQLPATDFALIFINQKLVLFLFYHLLVCTNPTILSDAMLRSLILWLYLFYMLTNSILKFFHFQQKTDLYCYIIEYKNLYD